MITVQRAAIEDVPSIVSIYKPYVEKTAISFEYNVPSIQEMTNRILEREGTYPFLVLREDEEIKGYAYLSPFKKREAYSWSAETSIYLKMEERGRGLGSILLSALEDEARKMKLLTLDACIAMPRETNPYLDAGSFFFHEKHGYTQVARFPSSGYKFGLWFDMVWMEKEIGEHSQNIESVIWYGEVKDRI